MAKEFRVGIVGCGGIANGKHLPALKALPNVKMVAFCDLIRERAEKALKEYGAEDAKIYDTYEELVADPTIDVVHVLTPNKAHAPISIAAMEAGKDVMCEKPMAKTAADARAMVECAKRTGKTLTIGYQNRFRPDSLYLKKCCEAGDLGEVYYARAHAIRRRAVPTWGVFLDEEAQGGGPLIDIGTHALDLTLWEMNNYEVESVMGSVYRKLADTKDAANAWGPWDPEKFTVEDSAMGFIKMKNGATIVLEASWALNSLDVDEAKTSLCGTKAGADMKDGLRINGERFSKMYVTKPDLEAGGVAFYDGSVKDAKDVEAEQFYAALENGAKPTVLPEQALVVTEILEAIYNSAKTGKPVYFD
ncbi:MAG TPA: Gfo/Idh/MocA family oxidoreductase [Candidatus Onthenecus intestinigallinarum]|uniref:Gfo/Idh/MocA family oxidoreductase n=1 Tax=Candidatus Onthenecus intestinigallinarum TaxID=2840875 RepID=A0A9D0Z939_9FIRM|nr:Gfo/Idh/MocA family oxidoreductase [Candidatus Onthenecus intestinigallinarum]